MTDRSSYYKPKTLIHTITAGESGSGVFTLDPFSDDTVAYSGVVFAQVKAVADGTLRTTTKTFFDPSTGNVTVTGTYTEGDTAEVLFVKYV